MQDLGVCSLYNFFLEPVGVFAHQTIFQHRNNMYAGEYQPSYRSRFITHPHHHHHRPSHGGEIVVGKVFAILHMQDCLHTTRRHILKPPGVACGLVPVAATRAERGMPPWVPCRAKTIECQLGLASCRRRLGLGGKSDT